MSGPAVGPEESAANPRVVTNEFLWHVHGNLSEQIKFCDQKSGFVALLSTGILGALHSQLISSDPLGSWGVVQLWGVCTFVCLALSLVACFLSIVPRSRFTAPRGFIFWGAIAAYDNWDEFTADLMAATPETLTEHLSHQTYALARICKEKFAFLNWGMTLAALGTGMAAGLFVIAAAVSQK